MPKEQRTFTKEFKLEAVQLVRRSGKSQVQVARELGIAESTLHHWCKLFADQGQQAFVGSGHQTPEEEELRRLKRELEVTRQERAILKKSPYRISPNAELIQRALKQPVEPFLGQSGMRQMSSVGQALLKQKTLAHAAAYQERVVSV